MRLWRREPMKRKFSLTFSTMLVLSLLLAACGGGAATPTQPVAQPTQGGAEPTQGGATAGSCAAAQGVSFEMWSLLTGQAGYEMSALAAQFSAENPDGIQVSHVAQPEYVQKLNAAAAANGLPVMT